MYIYNLDANAGGMISTFVNDMKIGDDIYCNECSLCLKNNIEQPVSWAKKCQMEFNPKKK